MLRTTVPRPLDSLMSMGVHIRPLQGVPVLVVRDTVARAATPRFAHCYTHELVARRHCCTRITSV